MRIQAKRRVSQLHLRNSQFEQEIDTKMKLENLKVQKKKASDKNLSLLLGVDYDKSKRKASVNVMAQLRKGSNAGIFMPNVDELK